MAEEKTKKEPPTEYLDDDFDDVDIDDILDDDLLDDNEEDDGEEVDGNDTKTEKDDKDVEDDGDSEKDKDKEPDKKTQSKEERAKQAKLRREREAKKRERREEDIRNEAYLKGKLDSTKVNTFTEEPIEDEYDLFIFETQKALEKEGKDPIADLPKRLAEINRKNAKENEAKLSKQKEVEEKIDKDIKEFRTKYPSVDLKDLLKDPDFKDYSDGRLGVGDKSLTQLYESFSKMKEKFTGKKSNEEEDNGKVGAPSPNGGRKTDTTSYSAKSKEEKIKELRRQGLIN